MTNKSKPKLIINKTTFLKTTATEDSTSLVFGKDKVAIEQGTELELHSYVDNTHKTGHLKIALANKFYGSPPRNTWYVYSGHVTLIKPSYKANNDQTLQKLTTVLPEASRPVKLIKIPGISHEVNVYDPISTSIPNFSWNEVTKEGKRIPLNKEIVYNILKVGEELQELRENIFKGRIIRVTSWYRPPSVNRAVGGASASRHVVGDGIDIQVDAISAKQVQRMLEDIWKGGLGYGKTFTHLDCRPYKARWPYN